MAINEKSRSILNFLLNDIAEIFPLIFIFYAVALVLSFFFDFLKLYFNWPIFHVNILILGMFSLLSTNGRAKISDLKQKIRKKITSNAKQKDLRGYVLFCVKQVIIWPIKMLIQVFAIALDIRQQSPLGYVKFILLIFVLSYALAIGAGILKLLILVYAFRAIFINIDSKISAGIAVFLLVFCLFLLLLKNRLLAERVSVYAFYFLIICAITQAKYFLCMRKD